MLPAWTFEQCLVVAQHSPWWALNMSRPRKNSPCNVGTAGVETLWPAASLSTSFRRSFPVYILGGFSAGRTLPGTQGSVRVPLRLQFVNKLFERNILEQRSTSNTMVQVRCIYCSSVGSPVRSVLNARVFSKSPMSDVMSLMRRVTGVPTVISSSRIARHEQLESAQKRHKRGEIPLPASAVQLGPRGSAG